jgi:type IV fimbrial biogenesis protein FimT
MRVRGFTLIELLVVMTIGAILVAAAVPAMQWLIARNRISDASSSLVAHLELARMEASRRGVVVSVCRSPNSDAVAPGCSGAVAGGFDGNDWAAGWIVFEKTGAGVDEANFEAGDRLLVRHLPATDGVRVMIHSNLPVAERVAFPPRGTGGVIGSGTFAFDYGVPPGPVASRALGSITLSNAARCLAVAPLVGAVRASRAVAGACT